MENPPIVMYLGTVRLLKENSTPSVMILGGLTSLPIPDISFNSSGVQPVTMSLTDRSGGNQSEKPLS